LTASARLSGLGGDAAFEDVAALGTRSPRLGKVEAFDSERGLGLVGTAGGARFGFQSTAIADGSRQIAVGSLVAFIVVPAPCGRYEAAALTSVDSSRP